MTGLWTIAARECCSLFRIPAGWVVIALYLFLSGLVFATAVLVPGEPASLRAFFAISTWLLLPVAPAISMRLVSEELRTGTIEPLMTSPVADGVIVAGKYLGACLFLGAMLAPTLLYVLILAWSSDATPDLGPILTGYLSLLLLGMLYLAVGLLGSALTSNQTLAFVGTLMVLLIVLLATTTLAASAPPGVAKVLEAVSLGRRVDDLARGVIDTGNVVFFLAISAWLLVLATAALQSRRWR